MLYVYRSVGREQVEQYLYRLLDPVLKEFTNRECQDITVQDADKQFVVDFYKYALVGMTLEWTRRDMKADPAVKVARQSTMLHGALRRALSRLAGTRRVTARAEDLAPERAEIVQYLINQCAVMGFPSRRIF